MTYRLLMLLTSSALLLSTACSKPAAEDTPDLSSGADMSAADMSTAPDLAIADMAPDQAAEDQGSDSPDLANDEDLGETMADQGHDLGVDLGEDMAADLGPATEPEPLRVATWNIHYLDTPEEAERAPRTEAEYERLRYYVGELDADVVALQEIHGVPAARMLFPEDEWEALCEDRNSRQNVCVVVRKNSDWQVTRHPDVDLRAGNPNLRAGLDITLTRAGLMPIRMLTVHMKAGCYFGTDATECATYFDQIAPLEAWIDARAAAMEPYIVIGDFNRFMTDDDAAWIELDDADPANADLTRSIASGNTPCWGGMFSEFIDHIMLDPTTHGWLQGSEQLVFTETDFEAQYEKLSDHCPLWADLMVPLAQ